MDYTINAYTILETERAFTTKHKRPYSKGQIEDFQKVIKAIQTHLINNKAHKKKWVDDQEWFKLKQQEYGRIKLDNAMYNAFPEPDFFTTKTAYYEYESAKDYVVEDHLPVFPIFLALKLRFLPLDEIYPFLDYQESRVTFDSLRTIIELKVLLNHQEWLLTIEQRLIAYNWAIGVEENHPNLQKVIKGISSHQGDVRDIRKEIVYEYEGDKLRPKDLQQEEHRKKRIDTKAGHEFDIDLNQVFCKEQKLRDDNDCALIYSNKQIQLLERLAHYIHEFYDENHLAFIKTKLNAEYFEEERKDYIKLKELIEKNNFFPEPYFSIYQNSMYEYSFKYFYVISQSSNNEIFDLGFVLTLRHLEFKEIYPFLRYWKERFEGDFFNFLDDTIMELDFFLEEKIIKKVQYWIRQKQPLSVEKISIKINPLIIEELYKALKPYFNQEYRNDLKKVLKDEKINRYLIFDGNATTFPDVFYQLTKFKKKALHTNKSKIRDWIIENFKYRKKDTIVTYKKSSVYNVLTKSKFGNSGQYDKIKDANRIKVSHLEQLL